MWFGSSNRSRRRRLLYLSLVVVLLVTTLLQVEVEVEAIRVFPGNDVVANVEFKSKKDDLFNKYFSGRRSTSFAPNNTTKKGFDEIKRKVPSCPDPLHN